MLYLLRPVLLASVSLLFEIISKLSSTVLYLLRPVLLASVSLLFEIISKLSSTVLYLLRPVLLASVSFKIEHYLIHLCQAYPVQWKNIIYQDTNVKYYHAIM